MFQIYTSNRVDVLAERLLAGLRAPPLPPPLEPEIIMVQSRGMARWLSLRLAEELHIWANAAFPFPDALFQQIMELNFPDEFAALTSLDPAVLRWSIMQQLPPLRKRAGFESVARYLADDDSLKLYQLAARTARLFDQYQVFRPDWLDAWSQHWVAPDLPEETRATERWQAALWRRLAGHAAPPTRHHLLRLFKERIAAGGALIGLPRRLWVFGITALPPFHLDWLEALAQRLDVHFFIANPCREYWEQIRSARTVERRQARLTREAFAAQHLEIGNGLLAAWGGMEREFVFNLPDCGANHEELYVVPPADTLLQAVQRDILELRDRGAPGGADAPAVFAPGDRSIQLHVAHSPLREVQILKDQLLHLLHTRDGLTPRDILVMAPDIETYTPFIEAVFGGDRQAPEHIPFSLSDRSARCAGALADVLEFILNLPASRFGATELLNLLEWPCVRRRFEFDEADAERIARWVADAGIRWGLDGQFKSDTLELPPDNQNTWRFGLDRLLLGYALPVSEAVVLGGETIQPCGGIEGETAAGLGRLVRLLEILEETWRATRVPHPIAGWCELLSECLDQLTAPDDAEAPQRELIRALLGDLRDAAERAGFTAPVDVRVVRAHLTEQLAADRLHSAFLGGGVTFCSLMPMRSIPMRVIALLGMNDTDFPRRQHPDEFDLMAVRSRVGDRTRRDDDRFMFLEALLAAREVLLISHVGRHIRDNSVIPPSVLVGELLDYLDRAFRPTPPAASVRDQLTTVHPLQPFSERYFTGSEKESGRLFSYSSIWCAAGRSRRAAGPSVFQPFAEPLPAPPAETAADIALDDFCRFFRKPVAELLNRRLGIRIAEDEEEPEDEEPFALSPLDRYHIYTRILDELPADRATEEYLAQFRAEGILPAGPAGRNALERVHATVRSFGAQVTALRQGTSRRLPVDVCLAAPALRLRGELTDIFPAAMIVVRCGVLRAADQLEAWIRHLARLTVEPDGATICLGFVSNADGIKIETVQFKPVASPAGVLATLARLYQEGQVEPLRLFPESACVYAAEWMQSHDRTRALQRARSKWSSNYGHGERELNARLYQYVFRGADELDPRFEEIARTVFEPLLAATK